MAEETKLTWAQVWRANLRGLKLIYQRCPSALLSRVFGAIWQALTPYVTIYLSALVIGELAGNRDISRLTTLVLLTLGVEALIHLVTALIIKWRDAQEGPWWHHFEQLYSEKFLDMDYVDTDTTAVRDLYSTIRQNENAGAWGLYLLLYDCEDLCKAVFSVFGGIALTVSLFLAPVPETAGGFTVLNNPLFILLILGLMLGITYLAPALENLSGSYFAKHLDKVNASNRMFSFFGFLGYNKAIATDVRIYRQEKFCEKYLHNKTDPFGSSGAFARLCVGPVGLLSAASAAVSMSFTGFAYAFVCLKAWAGAFGLGAVTQYVSAITQVSQAVSGVIQALGDAKNNTPFLELTYQFLDIPNKMYQGSLTVEKRNDRKYQVEFRDVSFRYPGSDQYALRHVNMKFQIGKRLAVVGMNGSGKTTFIKLLCRLYDPTEGQILLNGIDIRKYNYAEYMNIFSVVFQDFKLFSLKLGENVASQVDYDSRRAKDCLEKAGFGEKLKQLPQGLETYLYKDIHKEGLDISGGEAQKIAIARALYKDAPFIILDEPTAALDPIAEAEIYSKFNDIAGDKTAIYISHRLSSCKFCDEIAVFHEGQVVQQGTHADLVSQAGGQYQQLWHAQAQYYTEDQE